jgi:hypothetical protein
MMSSVPAMYQISRDIKFDGKAYDHEVDSPRLHNQFDRVFHFMKDEKWYTIRQVSQALGNAQEQSISATIRDMRKERFGGHTVERRRVSPGLYEYRLIINTKIFVADTEQLKLELQYNK